MQWQEVLASMYGSLLLRPVSNATGDELEDLHFVRTAGFKPRGKTQAARLLCLSEDSDTIRWVARDCQTSSIPYNWSPWFTAPVEVEATLAHATEEDAEERQAVTELRADRGIIINRANCRMSDFLKDSASRLQGNLHIDNQVSDAEESMQQAKNAQEMAEDRRQDFHLRDQDVTYANSSSSSSMYSNMPESKNFAEQGISKLALVTSMGFLGKKSIYLTQKASRVRSNA